MTSRAVIRLMVALLAALVVGVFAVAAQATTAVSYAVSGTETTVPGGSCLDCLAPQMDSTGTAFPVDPLLPAGTFTLNLTVHTFPPSPCKVKSLSGTLTIDWADATQTTVSVTGKFRDSKSVAISGTADSTSTRFPTDPMRGILTGFPPSPCTASTNATTGTLAFTN